MEQAASGSSGKSLFYKLPGLAVFDTSFVTLRLVLRNAVRPVMQPSWLPSDTSDEIKKAKETLERPGAQDLVQRGESRGAKSARPDRNAA
jgi:hypothetical protein